MRGDLGVEPIGQLACARVLWRFGGTVMATIVAKATFAFVPDGTMTVCEPEPVRTRDEHEQGHPARSIVGASELAPMLRQAEVVVVGHAHAPPGATTSRVRLALAGARGRLLDKVLEVVGSLGDDGTREPIGTLRLGYERALGGIGFADNPIGTGVGDSPPPNFVDPHGPTTVPAALGPVPSAFPARRRLLHGLSRKRLEQPIAEIPGDFDWTYFQCAPPDQRLPRLHGDEWLMLEGMSADRTAIRTQLPGVQAMTRVYGVAPWAPSEVPLVADTLHVDADAGRCTLVWRGSFPLVGDEVLAVGCALMWPGRAVSWPEELATVELSDADLEEAPPSRHALGAEPKFAGTLPMTPGEVAAVAHATPVPFGVGPQARARRTLPAIPGAPWAPPEAAASVRPVPAPRPDVRGTLPLGGLDLTAELAAREAAMLQARGAKAREAEAREAEARAERALEVETREADERRRAEDERFAAEQATARLEEERRAAEQAAERQRQGLALKRNLYSTFQRKKH